MPSRNVGSKRLSGRDTEVPPSCESAKLRIVRRVDQAKGEQKVRSTPCTWTLPRNKRTRAGTDRGNALASRSASGGSTVAQLRLDLRALAIDRPVESGATIDRVLDVRARAAVQKQLHDLAPVRCDRLV